MFEKRCGIFVEQLLRETEKRRGDTNIYNNSKVETWHWGKKEKKKRCSHRRLHRRKNSGCNRDLAASEQASIMKKILRSSRRPTTSSRQIKVGEFVGWILSKSKLIHSQSKHSASKAIWRLARVNFCRWTVSVGGSLSMLPCV